MMERPFCKTEGFFFFCDFTFLKKPIFNAMKNTLLITLSLFALVFISCGPSAEEIKKMEESAARQFDSLNKLADQKLKEDLRIQDSILKADSSAQK